jgi:hypothetical protein
MAKTATNPTTVPAATASDAAPWKVADVSKLLAVRTSAEALANLEEVRPLATAAANEAAHLQGQRPELLLECSDDELDALERAAAAAERQRDRLNETVKRLEALAAEFAAEEQRTEARAAVAKARQGIDRYPALLDAYTVAAKTIRDLIENTKGIHADVDTALKLAKTAGIPPDELIGLGHPAHVMSTPDKCAMRRVFKGDGTGGNRFLLPDHQRDLAPEDIPSNYAEENFTVPGKRVLNLVDPGRDYKINLPAPYGGEPIVESRR